MCAACTLINAAAIKVRGPRRRTRIFVVQLGRSRGHASAVSAVSTAQVWALEIHGLRASGDYIWLPQPMALAPIAHLS